MDAHSSIVLVNDDDDALFLLERAVRRAVPDAEITCLRDPRMALAHCETHPIHALVTDNTMPGMDGLSLVRALRRQHPTMPILMVTSSTHLAREAADAGVTSYLSTASWKEVGEAVAAVVPH